MSSFLKTNYIFVLAFSLLAVFLAHNFDSIGQDIGRHLKVGETIWQIKEVPKTNLFSFTEPDFDFVNHHWLSEVILFKIFYYIGFTGLILLKVFLTLAVFLLLFFTAKKYAKFWPLLLSFLFSIFIFIQRTEVRPEMFSFAILAFFLFVLFKAKYASRSDLELQGPTLNLLWLLPLAQLFWVNLHIYFFIGPLIFLFFLIDRIIDTKTHCQLSKYFTVFILMIFATLINPAGIKGALLPFNILHEYGYDIYENQPLSFISSFGFNLPIFIFKISAAILTVSFILTFKKARYRIFEMLVSAFFIYVGFKMLRNLPLYALASFPIMTFVLTDIQNRVENKFRPARRRLDVVFKIIISVFLVWLIFFVASGRYYQYFNLSRKFGFSIPNGLERAVDFVKENNIRGPMFNNFDVGGYLIWRLPEEKVFVDNRPEAYSVKFFDEIYKPMQENQEKWAELSKKYGINFIFFGHTDAAPWGQTFLRDIAENPDWKMVYVNEDAVILVRNNIKNSEIISKFSITEKNAIVRAGDEGERSNENKVDMNLILSRFFYNISWRQAALYFTREAAKMDSENPRAYLYQGLVHAYYTDRQNQESAAENIEKAIGLGLKDSQSYYVLGIVYMNLGRMSEAEDMFKKALEIDENNEQARGFLKKYF